ncbi:MAG: metallophosphoesterase [Tannerellaceae bacterium]|nr:metallophosphoesterase [Tannerellaceae bacterium]
MRVFLQSVFAQLLLNPYVFWRGWKALPQKKSWRIAFVACFALELLVFFTGFFFHKELPDALMLPILYVCGTWYVSLLYATMALLAIELVRLSNRLYPWYPGWVLARWAQTKRTLFFLVIAGLGGLMYHAYTNVANPLVRHVNISLPKGAGNPYDSLTIVMMSDLHIGEIIAKDWVRKYVSLSNAQHPDLVVLVGDLLDYESRFAENEHIEADLQQLKAPLGVYAVNGNHEYRANRHAKAKWIRQTGAILLVDSAVLINDSFYLIGRDDFINKRRQALHALVKDLDRGKPLLVLDHQPWSLNELAMNGVALGLHGHTHNGQLWPYPLLMKFIYECPYGYYRKGNTQYYVSSGIGIAGTPYRVGTVSELVVLHIVFV